MWLQHVVVADTYIELVETDCFCGIQVQRILQALNTTLARLAFNLAKTSEWSVQICLGSLNVPWHHFATRSGMLGLSWAQISQGFSWRCTWKSNIRGQAVVSVKGCAAHAHGKKHRERQGCFHSIGSIGNLLCDLCPEKLLDASCHTLQFIALSRGSWCSQWNLELKWKDHCLRILAGSDWLSQSNGPNTSFFQRTQEVLKQLPLDPRYIDPSSLNEYIVHSRKKSTVVKSQRDSGNMAFKIRKAAEVDV